MNEAYVEHMVARRQNPLAKVLKVITIVLAVIFCMIGLTTMKFVFLIPGILLGIVAYFFIPRLDVEYEYLYLDKEITIDKIFSKETRKRAEVIELSKMEFIAPYNSHELDNYKSRKVPVKDYSSKEEGAKVYAIAYRDNTTEELILIEPNEEMLKMIKQVFPRKVLDY